MLERSHQKHIVSQNKKVALLFFILVNIKKTDTMLSSAMCRFVYAAALFVTFYLLLQESLPISTTMCQGLAVRSLRSSSKVCSGWSTEVTTQLVSEKADTPVINAHLSYQAYFPALSRIICWENHWDVTNLLILCQQ